MDEKKRCSRCIMPSICPTIEFNNKGVCNFCERWDKSWKDSSDIDNQEKLKEIVEKARNPKAEYDCLSGFSGGKDSSYAIYLCKKYGLRQIVVTFDNGFLSDEALHNIKALIRKFSIAHVTIGPGWDELKKMYRHCLIHTGEFCSVCNVGIRASLYRVAKLYNIKSIIAGTSPRTEAIVPKEYFCTSNDYFKNVFKNTLPENKIRDYMYLGQIKRGLWHLSGKCRWIQLPRYVPWKEQEILKTLVAEAGWKGELWQQHTDCIMSDAKEYLNLKRFGFTEKTSKLSSLIRDGQITREKAIEDLQKEETSLLERQKEIENKIMSIFELTNDDMKNVVQKNHLSYLPKTDDFYNTVKGLLYK